MSGFGAYMINKPFSDGLFPYVPLPAFDQDALLFITNAGITDQTEQNAINQLVINLKIYGLWTKLQSIYPFVGGTASTHKFNLKDPRDLDIAFRLTFNGGWTHSLQGAQPNGTNGYANTFFNPSVQLINNNTHLSIYSRTSIITNGQRDFSLFINGGNPCFSLGTNTNVEISDAYSFTTNRLSASITTAAGLIVGSRSSSTIHKLYQNYSQIGTTDTTTNTQSLPNGNLYIGAANLTTAGVGSYSNKQYAFASIGESLTDSDVFNLAISVITYQTTLGRAV